MGRQSLRRRLGMGAAVTSAMLAGYGRPVMAGDCAPLGGGTYVCSNAADLVTDVTQTLIPGGVLGVTTTMGFGIDTAANGGHAIYLSADGGLAFTDSFQSLITGASSGLRALNANGGDLVIGTSGSVTGLAEAGLYARDNGTGSVGITTAGVQGQLRGLDARNFGGGGITIDSSAGTVAGTSDTGLYARNYSSGLLSITAAGVSGGDTGIFARTLGGGIVVTLTGGMVIGQTTGVYARNDGDGGVTIDGTAGTVTGLGLSITGIYGRDYGTGDLRLTTADVAGGLNGIVARNSGGGDLAIDSTLGTVSADAANSNGIYARDDGAGAVSVTTYDVRGQLRGIDIRNYGGGAVTVDSTLGTVEGIGYTGIYLIDDGAGAVAITTGSVTGGTTGIYANAMTGGLGILLTGGQVAGGTTAIHALNDGGGDLTIDSTAGVLTGSGMMSTGIFARDFGSGDLRITTAEVTASLNGIYARNAGGGLLTVDTTAGQVEGTASNGVYVLNEVSGAVTITTADVSGGQNGIAASNLAGSALTIDTTAGSVDSLNGTGISAYNAIDGLLSLATAGVSGGARGLFAHNAGDGGTTIDTTLGTVLGTSGTGLIARDDGGGSLQVTTAGVTGGTDGIVARNYGGGATEITTAAAAVTGSGGTGVFARDEGLQGFTITTAAVGGGVSGITAQNYGDGDLTIDSTAGTVTGGTAFGIYAVNSSSDLLSISTADVSGGMQGIRVRDIFGGAMAIATHGTVQGADAAIWVRQLAAGTVTLSNDGILRNTAGDAAALTIHVDALTGDTVLVENLADGLLVGQVELTAQDDSLDNAGTWRLAGGTSAFGLGNDRVMNQGGALMLAGLGGAADVTRLDGLELFENAGRLELRDGGLGDRVEVSGAFTGSGGGLVGLDIFLDDGSTVGDRLVVEGAVGGASVLALNVVGGAGAETGTGPGHGIVLVDASAGSTDGDDFTLLGGPIETGIYSYDLVLEADGIWYLQSSVMPAVHEYPNAVTASFLLADSLNGTLEERLGELRHRAAPGNGGRAADAGSGQGLNLWVRSVAEQGDYEPGGAPDFAQTNLGVVAGGDVGFSGLFGKDRLFLGVMAGYGHGDARGAASRFAIDGVAFGLYATYLLENGTPSPYDGLYLDLVGRATLLDVAIDSSAPLSSADYDATAWGASIEVGYGVELSRGLILEPQAQLSYSWLQQDDFVNSRGVAVSLDEGESLRGRLGFRLQRHWDLRSLGAAAPYLEFNLLHEFAGTNRIVANGVPFESGAEGTSYQAGFGLDALIGRDIAVYGSIKASWGEHVDNAVRAVAGLRLSF